MHESEGDAHLDHAADFTPMERDAEQSLEPGMVITAKPIETNGSWGITVR